MIAYATRKNPSIVFKGCTGISMSGQATNENKYENGVLDLFQDADIYDIFVV